MNRTRETRDVENGGVDDLAALDALLDAEGVAPAADRRIPKRGAASAPLSSAQHRLWFLHELDPAADAYTIAGAAILRGPLQATALEAAIIGVVARHEALRTTFEADAGEPRQVVHDAMSIALERRRIDDAEPAEVAAHAASELARRRWDLAHGPLLRAALLELGPSTHALAVAMHHIVSDGWSIGVLLREVAALYASRVTGSSPRLPELPIQYADYAAWQAERLDSGEMDEQLAYWRAALAGAPTMLDLPADRPPRAGRSRRGATHRFLLDGTTAARLEETARRDGATPFAALLACFQALIGRRTGRTDFVVGTPIAGRDREETAGLVGLFVNTVPLRAELSDDPTLRDLMRRARDTARSALAHGDAPFDRIVEAVGAPRPAGRPPLVQVLFAYQDAGDAALELPCLTVEFLDIEDGTAKFDLTLSIDRRTDGFACALEYDADLFEAATVADLARSYARIVSALAEDGAMRLSAFDRHATGDLPRPPAPEPAEVSDAGAGAHVAPADPIEEIIAGIHAELLGLDRVGVTESFFDLGGHSLIAARVVARLRRALGVELPLRALFEAPTARELARRVAAARRATAPPIGPAPPDRRRRLSYAQQRLWFLDRLDPGSAAYNIANAVRVEGELDVAALQRALADVVARHETLRTRFVEGPDGPEQVIDPPAPLAIPVQDLSALPDGAREREAARRSADTARDPFDLESGPVLRARLLRLGRADHVLVLVVHHIASDGWSMGVLVGELASAYALRARGLSPAFTELPVQYADWAAWQRAWLEAGEMERQLAWWRAELEDLPPLALPTDRPRPARMSSAGASLDVRLDPHLVARLARLARVEGATLHMVLLAAFAAVLSRWSGQRDFGVGTPVANRAIEETEPLIGLFVNTLVVRARLDGSGPLPYRTLLSRIREAALHAYANQDVPFERVVEALQPERDLSRTPLFQAMLILQNAPAGALDLGGLKLLPFDSPTSTATFDITLSLAPDDDALDGYLEYSTELFDGTTVRRLWDHLVRMLRAVAEEPQTDVRRVELLDDAEKERVLALWSGRRDLACGGPPVHERFARQAMTHPDRVAAVLGGRRVSYAQIERRSGNVAARLAALGVGPETRVGLCVERSPELLVGMMGILRAGGVFVPLDPDHPRERIAWSLEDSGARVVLASRSGAAALSGSGRQVLPLDDETWDAAAQILPPGRPHPESLAYAIYTSGTTGRPKGVMVTHAALAAACDAWERLYPLHELRAHLQMAGAAFDVCTGDVVRALCTGGTLVFCERERLLEPALLFELVRRERPEFAEFVPAVLRALAAHARRLPPDEARLDSFRVVVVGSDVWTAAEIDEFRSLFGPRARLANSYGVTEATIDSTCWFAGDGDLTAASPPIGRPLAHTAVHLLDAALEPVPPGAVGEIYLGGPAVARGYAGRPDLTAERFVPDPFGPPGARLYRTGDRGRHLRDGRLVFAGRADDQVKIRGQRIEPAEVESALAALDEVAACAVGVRNEPGASADRARLAAWVVPKEGAGFDSDAARRRLRERLPEAMVPSAFVVLDALPLTRNGKVDRRRLPDPVWSARYDEEEPATPVEAAVAAAFAEVLGVSRVGARADFFALGGHSLLATRVISRLRVSLGVELPLRLIFETPTVRGLAAQAGAIGAAPAPPPVRPAPDSERQKLSYAQRRLWFLDRLQPGSPAYNLPSSVLLSGELDRGALERSLEEIVRRHEALRTRFVEGPDGPRQLFDVPSLSALPFEDLSELDPAGRRARVRRITDDEARAPFDLQRGGLVRARLLRLAEREHRLLLTLHHIAADGWSLGVFVRELAALYGAYARGGQSPLPDLPVQYADWAAWQRAWLEPDEMARQLDWWRAELDGAETLAVAADRPRPARPTWEGASLELKLDADLRTRLEALARAEGATLHMALLAAYAATLGRWSLQSDFAVGTPVANRRTVEAESMIGFFVNTLPVRVRLSGRSLTFRRLLSRVREAALGAYAHQDVPFERVVEALQPDRYLGHNPVVQTLFALQNAPLGAVELPGLSLVYEEPETGVTRFDLELFLAETSSGLEGMINYSAELFDRDTVARFAEDFAALLAAAVERPDRGLDELAAPAPSHLARLRVEWNARAVDYPDPPLVHELVERRAAETPGAPAARLGASRMTYGELNESANRLARHLRRHGAAAGDLVAVCLTRSFDMLVALLGVMKAGAAYVPVDPEYPRNRIALILEDARAPVVLTQSSLAARLPSCGSRAIRLDADSKSIEAEESGDLKAALGPDALVYSVYTSGSTGRPKGVAMTHRAISNLLSWQRRDSGGIPAPRTLQFASLSFDVSFQEIFSTLTGGGEVVLVSEDERRDAARLVRLIAAHEVQRIFLPFVALDQIAEAARSEGIVPEHLREVNTAGEQLRITPAIAAFFRRLPGCRLVNHYGPSETHLVTTFELAGDPSGWPELPPIGRPIANAPVYLLDERQRMVPIGVPGEVYVGGAGLARGYLSRPDLTAERFLPDPFSTTAGMRLYRTGDVARFSADGNLEFLGRSDLQVKVRGYRVEPGEIEAVLARHPAVRQAAVTARDHRGGKRLAAYVVLDEAARADVKELRRHLASALPEFMVPSAIVALESLPLTPNGKIDRAALPEPDFGGAAGFVAPRCPEEEILCGIFAEVLELPRAGAEDDFFELGGHSLLATQVMSRVRRVFGVDVPLRALFETPTAAGLALALAAARSAGAPAPPPIAPAAAEERRALSYAQRRLWFLHKLDPGAAVYNLPAAVRLDGELDAGALSRALCEIVRRHETLRTRFVETTSGPEQVVDPAAPFALTAEEIPGPTGVDREALAMGILREEACRPFDLALGPVLRARLLRISPREHLLSLVVHHVAADGWSMAVLLREIGDLYAAFLGGDASPLAEPSLQYADWAAWQRRWLEGGELGRQLAWWRAELEGAPRALDLPADRARPAAAAHNGATVEMRLPDDLSASLARLARAEGATLHMALLAAWAFTLAQHGSADEVVVGTPVANRRAEEAETLVGFFVNTLAVRVRVSCRPAFKELLARVREASLGAYANQDVPFERVVEEIQPERALNRAPLFQTAFALQNARLPSVELPRLTLTPVEVDNGTAKFDLMLTLIETPEGLSGACEYDTDLFDRATIEQILSRYERTLRAGVEDPDAPLQAAIWMDDAAERRILHEWNGTAGGAAPGRLLHELFERQVDRAPDAEALEEDGVPMSYKALDARANRLAHHLVDLGAGPETRVALLLPRTPGAIVSMLAVLKSGAACVPLEPSMPAGRLRRILEDSRCDLVVTVSPLADLVAGTRARAVRFERDAPAVASRPASRVPPRAREANLAYVIYTSGSTGLPKGVGVEHRQIASYVAGAIERLGFQPGWRCAVVSTLAADLGYTTIFGALCSGGSLHFVPQELVLDAGAVEAWCSQRAIDCLKIVPSHLQALLGGSDSSRVLPRRLLVLGGEATPGSRLAWIRERSDGCRVAIHYGPTETTVGAIAGFPEEIDAARPTAPLGRPLGNSRAYLLDAWLRLAPPGVPAELHLAGDGVARGYLGRGDLTAERFVPDPFAAEPGARMYRTGDRARWLRDGRIEFLGRLDDQVKVRGNRVEPAEISAALMRHPGVREAAVIARPEPTGAARLCAYVVPDPRVSPTLGSLKRRGLPNGAAVAELNRNETDYIYREIFERRAYVRHGITLRDGDTVLDAGANIGLFTLFASLARAGGRTIACEPNPHLVPILKANAAVYAPAAIVLDVGLAEREREAGFTFYPGFSLLSGLRADAAIDARVVTSFLQNRARAGEQGAALLADEAAAILEGRFEGRDLTVRLRPLSDLIDELGVERIHLLKVNVEKSELDALRGVREKHWERIDQAVVEVDVASDLAPIVALFEGNGFEVLVDKDPMLDGTDLCYLYAARRGSGRTLARGAPPSVATPRVEERLLDAATLRAHLAAELPDYMVPAAWVFLEALPLTANGKLDRARLPEPAVRRETFVAPRGELQRAIARIWSEALVVERVGVHDNFFDLGGHSLLLAIVHARLRERLGADVSIVDLFRFPTVAALAERLAATVSETPAGRTDTERGARRRAAARARGRTRRGALP